MGQTEAQPEINASLSLGHIKNIEIVGPPPLGATAIIPGTGSPCGKKRRPALGSAQKTRRLISAHRLGGAVNFSLLSVWLSKSVARLTHFYLPP